MNDNMNGANVEKDTFGYTSFSSVCANDKKSQVPTNEICKTPIPEIVLPEEVSSSPQVNKIGNIYDTPSLAGSRIQLVGNGFDISSGKMRWRCVFALFGISIVFLTIIAIVTICNLERSQSKEILQRMETLENSNTDLIYLMPGMSCFGAEGYGVFQKTIYLPTLEKAQDVYCDDDDGGGWMVIQYRLEEYFGEVVSFNVAMDDYVRGFGNESGYWMGLDLMHKLTSTAEYELRIDLEDWCGNFAYSYYSSFKIGDAEGGYRLHISGYKEGTAGDSLASSNGQKFSTKTNLPIGYERKPYGAWWYSAGGGFETNLNGKYYDGDKLFKLRPWWFSGKCSPFVYRQEHCLYCMRNVSTVDGIYWKGFEEGHGVLKMTKMKIRIRPGRF